MFVETDDYNIAYEGGRTADIIMLGVAVEVVPVRAQGSHGFSEPEPTEEQVRERVADWLDPSDFPEYRASAVGINNAQRAHERECHDPRCMCGKRRT